VKFDMALILKVSRLFIESGKEGRNYFKIGDIASSSSAMITPLAG
jgi:hypothetical protein